MADEFYTSNAKLKIMRKSHLLLAAISCLAINSFGQTEVQAKTWKISSIGGEFGFIRDSYQKMDLSTMYDLTKNPALLSRDLSGFDENLYRESGGAKIGINVSFSSPRANNWSHEIRTGVFYSSREPMISYNSGEVSSGENRSIIYCNVVNELSADGAYLLRKSVGSKGWFSVYGGIGATIGSSFNNKTIVMESTFSNIIEESSFTQETYEAKSSLFTRLYVPVGFQATLFKRFNLGLETNIGIGMQSVYNGRSYFMPINTGLTTKLSFNL
jgi:hypothetical protein